MTKKLYVGSLSYSLTEEELKEVFAEFGQVETVKIIIDAFSGSSKGFGFVEMSTEEEANSAIEGLNGKEVGGRTLVVSQARAREARSGGGGGGGGRGGYGGGGGGRSGGGGGRGFGGGGRY
ncbi:RNA-binding protein [bacterium]|nr:RNA-binding protein [bacterium]